MLRIPIERKFMLPLKIDDGKDLNIRLVDPSTVKASTKSNNATAQSEMPDFDMSIENYANMHYEGSIYVGGSESPQVFQVVLDTGSSKLVLLDSTCENCYGEVFNSG